MEGIEDETDSGKLIEIMNKAPIKYWVETDTEPEFEPVSQSVINTMISN